MSGVESGAVCTVKRTCANTESVIRAEYEIEVPCSSRTSTRCMSSRERVV